MILRNNAAQIKEDLSNKIVFITGPRQSGKTTLAKSVFSSQAYLNFDDIGHRGDIMQKIWDRSKEVLILDELHKMDQWKRFLKGVFDTEPRPPYLLVTGSAKMETFRRVGDSLAGRFFSHRLYPFDVKELISQNPSLNPVAVLDQLLMHSGFPEPFIKGSEQFYARWVRTHLDVVIRQDLVDLKTVKSVSDIFTLVELLRYRVGSPISYSSLARDLNVNSQTVKSWIILLENLYILFRIFPYSNRVTRSIQKEPKIYFFNTAFVKGSEGIQFENLVAVSLLKEVHFLQDTLGKDAQLYFLKNRNGKEVDFCVTVDEAFSHLIECKLNDMNLSGSLLYFSKFFNNPSLTQVVRYAKEQKMYPNGATIAPAAQWLSAIDFLNG